MDARFSEWLVRQGIGANSLNSYLQNARNMEAAYGDLDAIFDEDQFADLIETLVYSKSDERAQRPNPSKVPIKSHLYKTLASHRTVLRRYAQFRDAIDGDEILAPSGFSSEIAQPEDLPGEAALFGLEKDMQTALRANIAQIEAGLAIIDGGAERNVASGFIDILARDGAGRTVVIELKAVKAPLKAMAQIAAYMGDIAEAEGALPRGILIAPDFDARLISAARTMPTLSLTRYRYSFTFEPVA